MPIERDAIFIANLPLPSLALIMLEMMNWRKGYLDQNRKVLTLLSPMNMEVIVKISPGPSAGHGSREASIGIIVHWLLEGPNAACDCGLGSDTMLLTLTLSYIVLISSDHLGFPTDWSCTALLQCWWSTLYMRSSHSLIASLSLAKKTFF